MVDTNSMQDSPAPVTNDAKDVSTAKVRRRNRMITSCLECRRRKLKCDKQHPCTNCTKFSRECMFLAPALDSVSQKRLNEIKEKMGSLERTLEEDVARRNSKTKSEKDRRSSADLPGEGSESDQDLPVPEDEKILDPTPLASVDAVYEDNVTDDVTELGFKVGKFRMSERLGGLFRPKIAEELIFAMVRDDKTGREPEAPLMDGIDSIKSLEPSSHFIAPGNGFLFGDLGPKRNLIDFLPTKAAGDLLIQHYHQNVHFICRVVHWPSFQMQYENFWTNILSGVEPPASLQAIVFAVMFSALASMQDVEVMNIFHTQKRVIQDNFQTATEVSLSKAHFLRTTKFETLQAFVIYLIPMCRDEISRAHSILVGAAIRLGECFGLHRDPAEIYGMSPIETHVRRILWFQLCFLDLRTAESHGPKPSIKREDYDTKLPLNIDDLDLMTTKTPREKQNQWTDMTLSRMRFECVEMQRIVYHDRIRLDKKKVSITYVLGKIEAFRKAVEEKYKYFDTSITIQHYARLVLDLLSLRMHIMILHKYHTSTTARIPDRLRQIILSSGTKLSESAVELDRLPQFERWKWYNGAHQQWHAAFLMVMEVFQFPGRREADRIWAVTDYVFEPNLSLSRVQKARSILGATRDRAKAYNKQRKLREPVSMKGRIPTELPMRAKDNGIGMIIDQTLTPEQVKQQAPEADLLIVPTWPNDASSVSPSRLSDQSGISPEPVSTSWTVDAPHNFYGGSVKAGKILANDPDLYSQLGLQQTTPQLQHGSSPSNSSGVTDNWTTYGTSASRQGWRLAPASPPSNVVSEASVSPPAMIGNSAMGLMSGQYLPEQSPPSMNTPPGIRHGSVSSMASYDPVNVAGGEAGASVSGQMPSDQQMLDIDWGEWDKLFPPETNTGNLDMPVMQQHLR